LFPLGNLSHSLAVPREPLSIEGKGEWSNAGAERATLALRPVAHKAAIDGTTSLCV